MSRRFPVKRSIFLAALGAVYVASLGTTGYVGYAWAKLDVHLCRGSVYTSPYHYPDYPGTKYAGLHHESNVSTAEQFNEAQAMPAGPGTPLTILLIPSVLWWAWGWLPIAPSVPRDERMLCPQCRYCLKFLPKGLCPECGTAFDPEAFLKRDTLWWASSALLASSLLLGLLVYVVCRQSQARHELDGTVTALVAIGATLAVVGACKNRWMGLVLMAGFFAAWLASAFAGGLS